MRRAAVRVLIACAMLAAPPAMAGAVCGDGTVDTGEQCDDGNLADGDCCSSTCRFEALGTACDDGNFCTVNDVCNGLGTCAGPDRRDCDDRDPCTIDLCVPPGQCGYTPVGFPATQAKFTTSLKSESLCSGRRIPGALTENFKHAGKLVEAASAAPSAKRQRKLVKKAILELQHASSVLMRNQKALGAECFGALRIRINGGKSRTGCLIKFL